MMTPHPPMPCSETRMKSWMDKIHMKKIYDLRNNGNISNLHLSQKKGNYHYNIHNKIKTEKATLLYCSCYICRNCVDIYLFLSASGMKDVESCYILGPESG